MINNWRLSPHVMYKSIHTCVLYMGVLQCVKRFYYGFYGLSARLYIDLTKVKNGYHNANKCVLHQLESELKHLWKNLENSLINSKNV